jgi:hypothetical protein
LLRRRRIDGIVTLLGLEVSPMLHVCADEPIEQAQCA